MQDSEFYIQQLIVATRWEFDIPTFLMMVLSVAFALFALLRKGGLPTAHVIALQLTYVAISAFLYLRFYAAVVRLRKLSLALQEQDPVFEYWNAALQIPTFLSRNALFVVLLAVTLYLLWQARKSGDV